MKDPAEEPLFTIKGLVLGAALFSIYAVLLFSMDPEWVGWAGPMALGALYVPNSPPPLFSSPQQAFQMGFVFGVLNLLTLVLVSVIRGELPFHFAWLSRLKLRLKNAGFAGLARAGNHLRSRWVLHHRVLISTQRKSSIASEVRSCHQLAVGEKDAATLPHCSGAVSKNLGVASPEDLSPLH